MLLDALCWAIALITAEHLRFEFAFERVNWLSLLLYIVIAAVLQVALGWKFYLYRGRWSGGSFDEVRALANSVALTGLAVALLVLVIGGRTDTPRSIGFIALPIALVLMFSLRYLKRSYVESKYGPGAQTQPMLIFGAGDLGSRMARVTIADTASPYWPVGFIDDDPEKLYYEVRGVRVLGGLADLADAVAATRAKVLLVAIADASTQLLRQVQEMAAGLGLQVKIAPTAKHMLADGGNNERVDLRDLSIEDLLGRPPLDTGVEQVAGYLTGRRVLVTGAGGSIGSELCAQIARFGPAELIMLDRDETALQQVQLAVRGNGLLDSKEVVLADIRDETTLEQIFVDRRPEVVFHAAALKHLPMLEQYPDEAWKTNVLGTLNTLEAARRVGVELFVNISTDKAANPTSVLGHSKRVAEKLTAWMGEETGRPYISVRFGNVIGSRGSMLPTFTRLIEQGGPLTVTHPDVTRFFMTIPEACQLVVQAGALGSTGEVLILDMGEPVRILDIAERMIEMSGKDIEIVFTGLREGEKLHEELVGLREAVANPHHPKIAHANVDSLSRTNLDYSGWRARMAQQPRNNDTSIVPRLKEQR